MSIFVCNLVAEYPHADKEGYKRQGKMIKDIINHNAEAVAGKREMEALHRYFPQCFNAVGEFDIEAFKASLPGGTTLTDEASGFSWLGKNYARMLCNMDTTTLIRPDEEHNSKPENRDSQNVYISGDNLDALQHLVKSYSGRVKVIYIDPPYNTGSDGFVYNDKFNFSAADLAKRLDVSPERAERILSMTRRGSASHAAWLTFMLPRLSFARDLLTDDGVIFISIDDNEQANLKKLCDEVFGEENMVGEVVWKNVTDNNPTQITIEHEYILCCCKNKELLTKAWKSKVSDIKDILVAKGKELNRTFTGESLQIAWKEWYSKHKSQLGPLADYKFIDEHGIYTGSRSVHNPGKNGYHYDIIHPVTRKVCKEPLMGYRFPEESMKRMIEEGRVLFGEDENKLVEIKVYASEYQDKFSSVFEYDGRTAANELRALFPECKQIFKNPKPTSLIEHILSFLDINDGHVVDFFGGSSTTAHAILNLNGRDGGNRKFILVQWQEECKPDSEAAQADFKTIDQIGMERIKRAAKKIREQNPLFAGDLGFKHFTLEEPKQDALLLMEQFDPRTSSLTPLNVDDFGRDTVLRTWLVADGYGLTAEAEEVKLGSYTAYWKDDHLYMVNPDYDFDASSIVALMDKYNGEPFSPHNIVVFGYSFGFTHREELQKNLRALKDGNKTLNVNIDVRY